MDKLLIQGGRRLHGEIDISGAKNAALPMLCASLLGNGPLYLDNVPDLQDVRTMLTLLAQMGMQAEMLRHTVSLDASRVDTLVAPYELVKTMRASILVLGPLLARFGKAYVSLPGGCAIGARPIDQHIKGLQAMGAEISVEHGYIDAHIKRPQRQRRLQGCRFAFDQITVTGTENLLMAATLAEGETILENAAREPEVADLANLLVAMGARISGIGTDRLVIRGVDQLHSARYTVIPDRIEAGTFLCAVTAARGDVTLRRAAPAQLETVLKKLRAAGANIQRGKDWLRATMHRQAQATSFRTAEYPAFPTDLQAQFMTLNCIAAGCARITETIYENRLMHVSELNRLGAKVKVNGNQAFVTGVAALSGAQVMATDLRASASLVIAGLVADGKTVVERVYHLDRGYERMEEKLRAVGACVQRIVDENSVTARAA